MRDYRSGPLRGGNGTFGNGTYMAAGRRHAAAYADGSPDSLGKFGLRADAKVVRWPDLSKEFEDWFYETFGEKPDYLEYRKRPEYEAFGDIGAWATARGYDAIHILKGEKPGFGLEAKGEQYNVLNRAALIGEAPSGT